VISVATKKRGFLFFVFNHEKEQAIDQQAK
jgi:hypothetical protein